MNKIGRSENKIRSLFATNNPFAYTFNNKLYESYCKKKKIIKFEIYLDENSNQMNNSFTNDLLSMSCEEFDTL